MNSDDRQTRAQEAEYVFPYHYIPVLKPPKFSSTRHWDWGFRYLGGIELVLDQLADTKFASLIDIGCGDGRLLREIALRFPSRRLLGVDLSQRAVRLGQALNPELDYRALDIVAGDVVEKFEVVTLIEVVEHILPTELPEFIRAAVNTLANGGKLVLTAPHLNKPLIDKHYQHFTGAQLQELLALHFDDIRLIPFDVPAKQAPLMWLIQRVLGPKGRWFVITHQRMLYLFYRLYLKRYLYAGSESRCERIAVVCTKKRSTR